MGKSEYLKKNIRKNIHNFYSPSSSWLLKTHTYQLGVFLLWVAISWLPDSSNAWRMILSFYLRPRLPRSWKVKRTPFSSVISFPVMDLEVLLHTFLDKPDNAQWRCPSSTNTPPQTYSRKALPRNFQHDRKDFLFLFEQQGSNSKIKRGSTIKFNRSFQQFPRFRSPNG